MLWALTVLDVIKEEKVSGEQFVVGTYLCSMVTLVDKYEIVGDAEARTHDRN